MPPDLAADGIQPAPAVVKAVGVSGTPVTWPDTVPEGFGFVHVSETQELSPALHDHFLPVRKMIMGTSLCEDLAEPGGPGVMAAGQESYTIDRTIAAYAAPVDSGIGTLDAAQPLDLFNALSADDRVALAERLSDEIAKARADEQSAPGAFVEARRPH